VVAPNKGRGLDMELNPVRNPVKKSKGKYPGYFLSLRMDRMVGVESTLERDQALLLDFDPSVRAFVEQPEEIEYRDGLKWRTCIPDFLVVRADNRTYFEVKPEAKAVKPEYARKFSLIRSAIEARGDRYRVVTEMTIRRQPRLQTLERIHHYARVNVSDAEATDILKTVRRRCDAPLQELVAFLNSRDAMQVICRLVVLGGLRVDLSKPFGRASIITASL